MPNVGNLCALLARSLGTEPRLPARMARALGIDIEAPADVRVGARLLIAILCSETPKQARTRGPLYEALPLVLVNLTLAPEEDGTRRNATIPIEDFPVTNETREIVVRMSRSLLSAIELMIERCIRGTSGRALPILSLYRRSEAPIAFAFAFTPAQGVDEQLVFRRPSDPDTAYAMASYQLNSTGDCHGVVLEAIADLLREPVQAAPALAPGDLLGFQRCGHEH